MRRVVWLTALLAVLWGGSAEAQSCNGCGIGYWYAGVPATGGTFTGRVNISQASAGYAASPLWFTDNLVAVGRTSLAIPWLGLYLNGALSVQFTPTTLDLVRDTSELRLGSGYDVGIKRTAAGGFQFYNPADTTTQVKATYYGGYGSYVEQGEIHESITISTAGTTTDSTANLLPANALIEGVAVRVTTAITGAGVTHFNVGDGTDGDRFASTVALAAGTSTVGLLHTDQTGTAGPLQTSAAKLRITAVGATPTGGVVRVIVYYRLWAVPSS